MNLRIPLMLALLASVGAFLCLDKGASDAVAPAPGLASAAPGQAPPAPLPAAVTAAPAGQAWFAVVEPERKEAVRPAPKIRAAADVVSIHPPVRLIHPSLIGSLSNVPARAAGKRAGDRIEKHRVEARAGDSVPPRYGDTVRQP